jgi:hypothetical protein
MNIRRATSFPFTLAMVISFSASVFGQTSPSSTFTVDRNLVFTTTPEKTLTLNLYRPAKYAGKVPVVVMITAGPG